MTKITKQKISTHIDCIVENNSTYIDKIPYIRADRVKKEMERLVEYIERKYCGDL